MGVTKFLIILLATGIFILSYTKSDNQRIVNGDKKPFIEFYKSVMYTIDDTKIEQMIQSNKTFIYDKIRELYDASIIFKTESSQNTINAKNITQSNDIFYINNDVYLHNSSGFDIKTNNLVYDSSKNIIYNNSKFYITYLENKFSGINLYYDIIQNDFIANNINMKINLQE